MFKATITNKQFRNGMLAVHVSFENGNEQFVEVFETNQRQSPAWIEEQIASKLTHLNELPSLFDSITCGKTIEPKKAEEITKSVSQKHEYADDLRRFEKFVSVLSKGFTTKDNEDFIALKDKLTKNFKPEYIDLF